MKRRWKKSFGLLFLLLAVILTSCTVKMRDVRGLYAGVIHDLNEKTAEYMVQLYENGKYALRKTVYEDGTHSIFRTGTWSVVGSTVILVADGEKDLRFSWEHYALRIEASATALPNLPFDQVSLMRIGP